MYDPTAADKFLNSLFANTLPHIFKVVNDCRAAATPLAHQYALSNDPSHRLQYLSLSTRIETMRKMCRVMLEDKGTGALIMGKINDLFPELLVTKPAQVVAAKTTTDPVATPETHTVIIDPAAA